MKTKSAHGLKSGRMRGKTSAKIKAIESSPIRRSAKQDPEALRELLSSLGGERPKRAT